MARIAAPVYLPAWMVSQDAGIPAVCCAHGRPATRTHKVRVHSKTPVWALFLLVLGVLPFLLVVLLTRRTVVAPAWPFCSRCEQDRRRKVMVAFAVGVVTPAALILPLFVIDASEDGVAIAFLVAVLMMVVGLVLAARAGWSALHGLQVTRDGASLVVEQPARAFMAALPPAPAPQTGVPAMPRA